ncbi:hypothetical protein CASFOL_026227 [Castilleja foliolosa]|uniref:Uncharacterized protein n=1 Tax=Castilleja foliolosa TaxID=1961234 RepID=A0ABD3CJ16_9LAMI
MNMDLFKKFEQHLVEGGLCRITHLLVKDNDWKGKTTTNQHRLSLYRDSKVLELKCSNFPSQMHDLKEFHELTIPKKNEPYQLIDVIGRVTSYQQPTKMPSLKTSKMDFKMVDTRVCEYKGEMKFQNTYHVTQLIDNGDDDVFHQFRNS